MKSFALAVVTVAVLAGCSSVRTNPDEPIRNQKLSTSFTQEGVKIETNCAWYTIDKSNCEVVAIESVGTTTTNGNTSNNRSTAFTRAELRAKANVRHFLQEEITSSRVNTTIAKNVEKAKDVVNVKGSGEVTMTDQEAKESNSSVRENSNDTAHQVTETVRANAQGILRGFKVVKQEVTGPQEVSVTIRWDLDSDRTAQQLRKRFGN